MWRQVSDPEQVQEIVGRNSGAAETTMPSIPEENESIFSDDWKAKAKDISVSMSRGVDINECEASRSPVGEFESVHSSGGAFRVSGQPDQSLFLKRMSDSCGPISSSIVSLTEMNIPKINVISPSSGVVIHSGRPKPSSSQRLEASVDDQKQPSGNPLELLPLQLIAPSPAFITKPTRPDPPISPWSLPKDSDPLPKNLSFNPSSKDKNLDLIAGDSAEIFNRDLNILNVDEISPPINRLNTFDRNNEGPSYSLSSLSHLPEPERSKIKKTSSVNSLGSSRSNSSNSSNSILKTDVKVANLVRKLIKEKKIDLSRTSIPKNHNETPPISQNKDLAFKKKRESTNDETEG